MKRLYNLSAVLLPAILIVLLFTSDSLAGWVEVNKHSDTVYITDTRVKMMPQSEGGPWSVFDVREETITLVKPAQRSYMVLDPEELCAEMASMTEMMMKEVAPQQRAMMEQMRGAQEKVKKVPVVVVTKVGSGGSIAGYATVKYTLTVDDKPYKEVWLAIGGPSLREVRELMKSVMNMHKKLEGCTKAGGGSTVGTNPELSKEYLDLIEKGWMMKEVNLQDGKVVSEVESLERRDISASDLDVPPGYRKLDMKEMMRLPSR